MDVVVDGVVVLDDVWYDGKFMLVEEKDGRGKLKLMGLLLRWLLCGSGEDVWCG